jgi:uncharacterized protein YbaP (TraB family)
MQKYFLNKPNMIMVESLSKPLDEENTFIAAGAGHLGSKQGLFCLLSQRGYKISRVAFMIY